MVVVEFERKPWKDLGVEINGWYRFLDDKLM